MNSNVGWDKRVEAELLDGDTELGQLAFVRLDHVGMSLANLLERRLDLTNGVGLEVLDLFKSATDDTKCLRFDPGGRQQLINLCILSLERLLDGLVLLLENQVADARLLVDLVDQPVEFVKQRLLLPLEVLELLEADLVLPFDLLDRAFVR